MRRIVTSIAVAATLCAAALLATAVTASAATSSVPFTTCADAPDFGCAHLTVPLDPTGAIPGEVTLTIRRKLAATGTATEAVVALAGGPGQAAVPFATDAAQIMSSALTTRDLIVFDQRGTGDSGPLQCSSLTDMTLPISQQIPDCANAIGATRGLYTTDDSVYDIERLREALGYTKLILYGTSYGTKVALRYAAEYPQNTAGLVLDSTVLPNGPDVFDQSSFQAVPRILRELCASGACPGIPNPLGDLETVLAKLEVHPVRAPIFVGAADKRTLVKVGPDGIANLLISGDLDPVLRNDFPAAIAAAAQGDYRPLAILINHANEGANMEDEGIDNALYYATSCEEIDYPWDRADPPAERYQQALAAAKAMPAGSFGPFDYKTAFDESNAGACAYWPFATSAPEPTLTSLPDVPTLIISGADDLRTPTANARAVASMIPDATVVVVPQTGHSTLTTEFGPCGTNAVAAFFEGNPIDADCKPVKLPGYLLPAHAVPTSLAGVTPMSGTSGLSGRTAEAVLLSIEWTARELDESNFETLIGDYNPAFDKGLGGLYGGYAKESSNSKSLKVSLRFHDFAYVPGVRVSGTFVNGVGKLRISGDSAALGKLVSRHANEFSGTLGGVHVSFRITDPNAALTASLFRR